MSYENKGKDRSPVNTVEFITEKLKAVGLEAVCEMYPPSVDGCCFCRVNIDGYNGRIGANGKGTDEDYCRASGYAELIERLQNLFFFYPPDLNDLTEAIEDPGNKKNVYRFADIEELSEDENSLLNVIVRMCAGTVKKTLLGWSSEDIIISHLKKINKEFENNKILVTPYYDYIGKKYEWVPISLLHMFSMSNGMAAGNTLEEAVVQAASEIFERLSQKTIITERITPPDLPQSEIEKFPQICGIIKNIESSGPYKVIIKDCSLGKNIPAVCGIVINTETQTFGVKFGASPELGIALERVFTESFQGRTLNGFTVSNIMAFSRIDERSNHNAFNCAKTGVGIYPASIFGKNPSYGFTGWNWESGASNAEQAKKLLDLLCKFSTKLLISDMSFLGFPTVQIYAAGVSELCPCTQPYLKEVILKVKCTGIMSDIDKAGESELEKLILCCRIMKNSVLENTVSVMYGPVPLNQKFPCGRSELEFLQGMCNLKLRRYNDAALCFGACGKLYRPDESTAETRLINALFKYSKAKADNMPEQEIKNLFDVIADEDTAGKIKEIMDNDDFLGLFYPRCGRDQCGKCENDCSYSAIRSLYLKLYRLHRDSGVSMSSLHNIFG